MRAAVKKRAVLILLAMTVLIVSCRQPSSDIDEYDLEDQGLVEFYFDDDDNGGLDGRYAASFEGSIVYVAVPDGTNRSSLIPRFKIRGRGMQVDGVWQSSGSTVQDFTSSVVYDLVRTDDSRLQYSVVVGYGELSGNQLYEFGFTVMNNPGNLWENVTGIQNGSEITFYFPYGTAYIDFVPSFTVPAGAEVRYEGLPLTSGGAPFVNPGEGGTISVVFNDGSSKAFSVRAGIRAREAVYVQEGAVGALGTQQDPLGDLAAAYAMAKAEGISEIRISEGTYTLGTQLVIDENVKIKGGYNPSDWSDRQYKTPSDRTSPAYGVIINCSDATAGAAMDLRGGILFSGSDINAATLLEGVNVVAAGGGDYCSAVSVRDGADPVLRFSDFYGSNAPSGAGIFINNASPDIFSSQVIGNASGNISFGLSVNGSSEPQVVSCFISSSDGSTPPQGFGLDLDGNAGGLYSNNFIQGRAGAAGVAAGVRLMSAGGEFYNNIFSLIPGAVTERPFWENASGNRPDALKNNVFSDRNDGTRQIYHKGDGTNLFTIEDVNNLGYSGVSDNRALLFSTESSYENDAASGKVPPVIAFKGTTVGSTWTRDLYGNDRSSSWSIGPIEVESCDYDTKNLGFGSGADGSYNGDWSNLSISEAIVIANDWDGIEAVYETAGGGYTISNAPEMEVRTDLAIVNDNASVAIWPPANQVIFTVDDGSSGNDIEVYIEGFSFRNVSNPAFTGGAVRSREKLYFYDCVFDGNTARAGGGIYQEGGELHLANSVFTGNTAANGPGGGVYVKDGSFSGFNLIFTGNTVTVGGDGAAAYFDNSKAYIINSDILSNDATATEAAVFADDQDLFVLNSIFNDNSAGTGLADVNISGGTLTLAGSIVESAAYTGWPGVTQTLSAVTIGFIDTVPPIAATNWTTDGNDFHASGGAVLMVDHGIDDFIPQDWPDADDDGNTSENFPYDLAKTPRSEGASVDAGPYESF